MKKGEKRGSKRIRRVFVLRVAINDDNPWPRWGLVSTHDISAGGVSFTYDQEVKIGDSLLFRFYFVDRVVECEGKVVRFAEGYHKPLVQLAAKFVGLSEENKVFMERFAQEYNENKEGAGWRV